MFVHGRAFKRKHVLLFVCSSLSISQGALAQMQGATNADSSQATSKAQATADVADTNAQSQSSDRSTAGVADIVVAAQRFSETAQRTPLILSVIGSEELKGVAQLTQLQSVNPGVQIAVNGGLIQTFIRGAGSATVVTGQESAIAYNVDGVYLYSSTMVTPLMYDLERIEVLKGPQGTLYGRNASGGAINLITRGARLGQVEGYAEGEAGNYNRWRVAGAVNLPLGETFAVRLAAQHVEHDGYLSDGTDDQDLTAGRLRALWQPSSGVTLQVSAEVSRQGGRGPGTSINPNPTGIKRVGAFDPRINTGVPSFTNLFVPPVGIGATGLNSTQNDQPFLRNHQWSVNAQLDVDLGFATFTVLPAFRHEDARYLDYTPGFGDNQVFDADEHTVEARLSHRSDALKWVLGAYYFKTKNDTSSNVRQEAFGSSTAASVAFDVTSYAAFGEATFSVSDAFRLIGGLRYTYEKTVTSGQNNSLLPPFTAAFNPSAEVADFPIAGRASANAVTWKAGAELDLSPSSLLFATASRGFKGGGTFVNLPGAPSSFKPEYLTAFELGSRNRFFNNTLQLNGELFYWDLKNQQQTYLVQNGVIPVLSTTNAGKAHLYGGTIDIVWQPTPNDTLSGSVEYTKSKYDSFVREVAAFSTADLSQSRCIVGPGSSPVTATVDCTGLPLQRSPKWSATAGYDHRFDLPDGAAITFNGNMTYSSARYLNINYLPYARQGSNALFNSSLTLESANKSWTVTGWIRNITNKRVMTTGTEIFTITFTRPSLLEPRTFGGTIRYAF